MKMAGKYAADTTVPMEKSRNEIERTLTRYGAESFAYAISGEQAQVGFVIHGRHVRFRIQMPDAEEPRFTTYKRGSVPHRRTESAQTELWEKACRQVWRALALVIKAKLEAVAAGITTIEDEFLAHTLLPDGQTFGEWARPQVDEAYRVAKMPDRLMIGHDG